MIKRTGEMALGIIGAVFFALISALGVFLMWLSGNEELQQSILNSAAKNPQMKTPIDETVINQVTSGGITLFIGSIIALVLGIIAMIYLKGNKKPKLSGILLIIGGALSVLVSGGSGMIPAILYVIAGIMALTRKPKNPVTENGY